MGHISTNICDLFSAPPPSRGFFCPCPCPPTFFFSARHLGRGKQSKFPEKSNWFHRLPLSTHLGRTLLIFRSTGPNGDYRRCYHRRYSSSRCLRSIVFSVPAIRFPTDPIQILRRSLVGERRCYSDGCPNDAQGCRSLARNLYLSGTINSDCIFLKDNSDNIRYCQTT